ncbi:unnamed protein product [Brassica rapa]|uniref:Trichome birefringence-like N-terminal domain-containing protein n=1 Tax=Brassica campestris TaxID=3711 RepID=A0A8D9GL13_BRACM|nr:unnamed protein product [Brassica rapa]
MDQQQESNSMKQLFPLSSSPFLSTFKIKKHIFVGISLLVSFLIFSVTVVDLVGIKPHLCFEFLSSSLTKERRNNDVCDYSYGKWVRSRQRDVDGTSYGEECRFLDPGFRCLNNGRKDSGFRQWRWQPHGCDLPRKDAHPSRYREPGTPEDAPQDCSHWCLPGVPDTWNEILYAQLLAMNYTTK